jgi:hypothetical protein
MPPAGYACVSAVARTSHSDLRRKRRTVPPITRGSDKIAGVVEAKKVTLGRRT